MFKKYNLVVVGAGLFGSVVAEQASRAGHTVLVIDSRNHIGGNCYTEFDPETGINIHKYGAHIFHTDNDTVWNYINQFTEFNNYRHFVKSRVGKETYPMPINLDTINKYFGQTFTPAEAEKFLDQVRVNNPDPKNFEEQAQALLGKELYETFVKGYTAKQWETDPTLLPASVARRLPVRTDYDTGYFANNDKYQGIPVDGFTPIFERMLTHENIEVRLNTTWESIRDQLSPDQLVVYTGPVDAYFNYCYGQLNWRTLDFEYRVENTNDYQGCTAMNYPEQSVPWTREIEHRHFHPERKTVEGKTVVNREYSRAATKEDTPYYPVNTQQDRDKYMQYRELADSEPNVIFGGRLGEYMYYDMHQVIGAALSAYKYKIKQRMTIND
jgi:UDP-galactopyranose mutase